MTVRVIRETTGAIERVPFQTLKKGDIVFGGIDGKVPIKVFEDAEHPRDSCHKEYYFHDTNGNCWFPEDFKELS